MKKIGIFYGSTMGTTEEIANKMAEIIQADVFSVSDISKEEMENYDKIIWGSSTWGYGDLQDDWSYFFEDNGLPNLENKKLAIFGLGDQMDHHDVFVNAIGLLHSIALQSKAKIEGYWPIDGYSFGSATTAVKNNVFLGLALDQVNQPDLTDKRIDEWLNRLFKD